MKAKHEELVPVTIKLEKPLLQETDRLVDEQDLDRSKFIRRAIRDYLAKHSPAPAPAAPTAA